MIALKKENRDEMLFTLYVARVAKAETVQTIRRDVRAIFREALDEARVALEVFRETETSNRKG